MPNTRQDLIGSLVERKLYPKKKSTNAVLPDGSNLSENLNTRVESPLLTQPRLGTKLPVQPPVTKIEFPTKPLQKILFLKRTLGI